MKKVLAIILVLLCTSTVQAQQDEQLSLYMYNKLYFNPAYAGSRDAISAVASGRFQWVDFKGAPTTQWFSLHTPLMQKSLGLGTHLVNDRIGNRSRTSAYVDLSGSIALDDDNQRLSVGVSGGIDVIGYDFSQVNVIDPSDPYFGSVQSVTKANVGAGIYYYGDKHYVSFSVPRILRPQVTASFDSIARVLNAQHYFLAGGYVFDLNSVFKLQPSTLVKFTPGAPITVDANISLLMYDVLWTGIMYRFHESIGVNVVYNIKNTVSLGYVYDFPINGLRTYQNGSHEIFLRYDIRPKNRPFTSPRYF
ncbi:MAG: type IX secretion system membrane protein PorP/SprF [Crocinitomicaceae bacterium]|nr:type IX secretion system membrane protein PorP/SprF [Crocinitomicaceae bacterium]